MTKFSHRGGPPLELPPLILPTRLKGRKERLRVLIQRARDCLPIRHNLPRFLGHLFRPQSPYNRLLLEAVGILSKENASLINRVHHLIDCIDTQNGAIRILADEVGRMQSRSDESEAELRRCNNATLRAVAELGVGDSKRAVLEATVQELTALVNDVKSRVGRVEGSRAVVFAEITDLSAGLAKSLSRMGELQAQYHSVHAQVREMDAGTRASGTKLESIEKRLLDEIGQLTQKDQHMQDTVSNFQEVTRSIAAHVAELQRQTDRLGIHVVNLDNETRPVSGSVRAVQGELQRLAREVQVIQAQADRLVLNVDRLWCRSVEETTSEIKFALLPPFADRSGERFSS